MIKNIVFDVGKVLVCFEPDRVMENLGFDKKTQEIINQAVFKNQIWEESDRGILNPEELLAAFIANAPEYEKEIRLVRDSIGDSIDQYPYVTQWLNGLKKQGYHLYVLSNYADHTFQKTEHKLKFLDQMDGAVFSFQCKLLKPDKEIYEYLIEKYQLKPEECVFLDDREENIEGARSIGMEGIVFSTFSKASLELNTLLKKTK